MSNQEYSDDDSDYGQSQALPVADFDEYDPLCPPVSGPDYLRRVQLEAQKCPAVVVADIDPKRLASKQTVNDFNQVFNINLIYYLTMVYFSYLV